MTEKIIERNDYLNKIIARKENGLIKVITGIRRCGKSYILNNIFYNYLIDNGIKDDHIIKLALDREENIQYHDPKKLSKYIQSQIKDKEMYYVIIDEIQLTKGFEFVLNGLLYEKNIDVYVTGSNSKFLSSDIITEFRGRGDEVRIYPLSFAEFVGAYDGDKYDAWNEYVTYGGMPLILKQPTDEQKSKYFDKVDILDTLINILSSSVGSLTNPQKIYNTFISNGITDVSKNTVISYIDYLLDSFLIEKAERYDIKGKKYIQTPQKYYFTKCKVELYTAGSVSYNGKYNL